MMITTSFRDNPIFIHYGKIIDQCFDLDMAVGAPIDLFPAKIKGVDYKRADGVEEDAWHKHISKFAEQSQVKIFENKVNLLRETLLNEAHDIASTATTPITQKLKDFRAGLAQGSEAMLEENPFFELTALLYQINMTAVRRAFAAEQEGADADMPQTIKSSRSLHHIWGRGGTLIPFKEKVTETLSKVVSVGKVGFGLLLFVGSTITTAKGVTDLVQLPAFVEMFGGGLAGSENEEARFLLSIFIGLALSSVILDFKSRLFQGIAETGKVFKGYWNAFKLYPRWIFLSCFFTMISIWTNYDGIVLLMSKTQDLSYQWEKIENQVNSALGDPENIDADNPDSLLALKAALEKKAALAIAKFEQVPIDESTGSASSGVASKGPRYWAKHYIVHGNFLLGTLDVANSYRNTRFSKRIDGILQRSELDLRIPLEEQIAEILRKYAVHLEKTQAEVDAAMDKLGSQMVLDSYSLEKLTRLFNLEAYHINNSVQEVVKLLEANKNEFAATAQKINQLAASYIELLRVIDKLGTPSNNEYVIDVNIDIPRVEAIDRLKQGEIPQAKRRGLAELKDLLLARHGSLIGCSILFTILFIAIFMDMSDPILYSAMVARWGRRDHHFLQDNMARFVAWEEKYVAGLRAFFVRPEIQPLLPKMTCPRNMVFRHEYNYFLERLEPRVKDTSRRNRYEAFVFWFEDLFLNTRMKHVLEYNTRQMAVRRLINERDRLAPKLIDAIFPGLQPEFTPGKNNFDLLHQEVQKRMQANENDFFAKLNTYIPGAAPTDTLVFKDEDADREEDAPKKKGQFKDSAIGGILNFLFQKPLADPVPSSPLTRISWIKAMAASHLRSSSDINYLAQFTPDLEQWLVEKRFPVIQQEIIDPLDEILSQIPNKRAIDDALEISKVRTRYQKLKGVLTEVLGLSIFRGFQLKEDTLVNIIEASGVDEARQVFLTREMDVAALESVLDRLEIRLNRTYKLVKTLAEEQNSIVFTLTKIRRDHLSPINTILSRLQNRNLIAESQGLNKITAEIVSCEDFMLQLWNETSMVIDEDGAGLVNNYEFKQADSNPIINFFFCTKENVELTLLDEIRRIENSIKTTHDHLNSIIFTLTFIDKLAVKMLALLDTSADLVNRILQADQQLHIHLDESQEKDIKKLNFLGDNRLFFRSTPMQIRTIRNKVDKLLRDPALAEPYNVDLFRKLDNQTFKLHSFLNNSLAYLEGRRDGAGLSAALAQISPQFAGNVVRPAQAETGDTEKNGVKTPLSPSEIIDICTDIKELLERIVLTEWDMIKLPIPPEHGIAFMKSNKDFIDQSWLDAENMVYELERLEKFNAAGELQHGPDRLGALQGRAEATLLRLEEIYSEISKPFFADRRLEQAEALAEVGNAARRRFRESNQELCVPSEPDSRRDKKRVRITSKITLSTIIGDKIINGDIVDVSVNAFCIKADKRPVDLQADSKATFKFLADKEAREFNCQVVRVSGNTIILSIPAAQETAFSEQVRSFII